MPNAIGEQQREEAHPAAARFEQGDGEALVEPSRGQVLGSGRQLASHPPSISARRRLAKLVPLLAQGIDPMRSVTAASHLVAGAFAGVLLMTGSTAPIPGMRAHELLGLRSALVETVRARLIDGEAHLSFLWPSDSAGSSHEHLRVTYLRVPQTPWPDLHGVVLLSHPGALHGLTSRELDVLGMLVDGCSNQQIADRLVVTARTVATHVEHILIKLASPSRTHAAVRAQREGLYVPPRAGGGDQPA